MSEVAERTQDAGALPGVEADVFVAVCALDEIPRLGARVWERSKREGGNIALFRTADDRVFALDDRCPHKGGPLSQGIVHGDRVSCPLHGWNIVLDNGQAVAPDQGCAARHDVRIDQGVVLVRLGGSTPAR
jgi:nitrite reductase (NADH) small subunit